MRPPRRTGPVLLITLILAAAIGTHIVGAAPANRPLSNFWFADGPVNAIVENNGIVYIGGAFHYVGPATGRGAVLSVSDGVRDDAYPNVQGEVYAVVPDGAGGWFIGGAISAVDGMPYTTVVHFRSDKTLDTNWNPRVLGTARALALAGNTLYVGGDIFNIVGAEPRYAVLAIDATTGVVSTWNPKPTFDFGGMMVRAIAVSGNVVYVGGSFTNMGGLLRSNLAALEIASGNATAWNPGPNGPVNALAVSAASVFAGGSFRRIGGQNRTNLAALDPSTANALAWTADANVSGHVNAMVLAGNSLYVGGLFNRIGTATRRGVAALNATTGALSNWDPDVRLSGNQIDAGYVHALALSGSTLFIGGKYIACGGQLRLNITAVDTATGNALPTFNPGADERIYALAVSGNALFAGGLFSSIGGAVRNGIAALQGSTGAATSWRADTDFYGTVDAIAVSGSSIYAGGSYTNIGGQSRRSIAALDRVTATPTGWNPNPTGPTAIRALLLSGSTLYVGGSFPNMGGQSRSNLAALDPITATASAWNPRPNPLGQIYALALSGNLLYAGGTFTNIGGQNRRYLAALETSTASATAWNPGPDRSISAIAVGNDTVYATGSFTNIGGQARRQVAALDLSGGTALPWDANLSNPTEVRAVSVSGDSVLIGGDFTIVGGQNRSDAAQLDSATAAPTTWVPEPRNDAYYLSAISGVQAVVVGADHIYLGGQFAGYFTAYSQAGPARPHLTFPMANDGVFQFRLLGSDGETYAIEATTDFNSWNLIGIVVPVGGVYDFVDQNSSFLDYGAYRAYLMP